MLTSPLLTPYAALLFHGFTERKEGNLAFHVGDDPDAVHARQEALAKNSGYPLELLVPMRQIHSDIVCVADDGMRYDAPPECDALVTNLPERPLMVMVADCTPLFLFDPERRVIAAVHAGRAGAFANIVGNTLTRMGSEYGSDPADILAVLGPSIGPCCYEVGETIGAQAREKGFGYAMELREGRHCLNVNAIVLRQLEAAGIAMEHIEMNGRCTACEKERFFSYRAEGNGSGRFAGVIMLKRV